MDHAVAAAEHHIPWNKDRLVGQKLPLRLKEIWWVTSIALDPAAYGTHSMRRTTLELRVGTVRYWP
jgi:hypothetical protein